MVETNYTPWQQIFSYDADVTCVTDIRGTGKTFGLREQFLRDCIKEQRTFVQMVRSENRINKIMKDYFSALSKRYTSGPKAGRPHSEYWEKNPCVFRYQNSEAYYQRIPEGAGEDWKPDKKAWERVGYFVSLSQYQNYKEQTFTNVRRLTLDEALIEHPDGKHNYLPYEWERIVSIVDSCTRERPDSDEHKPNVYFLANACSIVNPIFQHYGITTVPPDGFSWYGDKTFLLYVGSNAAYGAAKAADTVAGRMSRGTSSADMTNNNRFNTARTNLIQKKTSDARFIFGMACYGTLYGVWVSFKTGLYYINSQVPADAGQVYALTAQDNNLNYIVARRMERRISDLVECYSLGVVRFESPALRERCENEVFKLYGIR